MHLIYKAHQIIRFTGRLEVWLTYLTAIQANNKINQKYSMDKKQGDKEDLLTLSTQDTINDNSLFPSTDIIRGNKVSSHHTHLTAPHFPSVLWLLSFLHKVWPGKIPQCWLAPLSSVVQELPSALTTISHCLNPATHSGDVLTAAYNRVRLTSNATSPLRESLIWIHTTCHCFRGFCLLLWSISRKPLTIHCGTENSTFKLPGTKCAPHTTHDLSRCITSEFYWWCTVFSFILPSAGNDS